MRAVAALLALGLPLASQSPFSLPFQSNNGGSLGGLVFFDLQVRNNLQLVVLDANFAQPAGTAGTLDVYAAPYTFYRNEGSPLAWSLLGTGTATAAGVDQPSRVTLSAPIALSPGYYGIALVCGPTLSHRYTSGNWVTPFWINQDLVFVLGGAQNVPFSGLTFNPRLWNGNLHYSLLPHTPSASSYGWGCPATQPLTLQASGIPTAGTTVVLTTLNVPSGTTLGAMVFGFGSALQHVYYGLGIGPGALGCLQHVPVRVVAPLPVAGPSAAFPLAIPSAAIFRGLHVLCQSVAFSSGSNPAGILTSNGVDLGL